MLDVISRIPGGEPFFSLLSVFSDLRETLDEPAFDPAFDFDLYLKEQN